MYLLWCCDHKLRGDQEPSVLVLQLPARRNHRDCRSVGPNQDFKPGSDLWEEGYPDPTTICLSLGRPQCEAAVGHSRLAAEVAATKAWGGVW